MSTENLFDLYSQKILALAMDIPLIEPIENSNGHAIKRSPLCGSQIEAHINFNGKRVVSYQQIVKTCALGQASSAIFGANVLGRTHAELEKLRDELSEFLKQKGPIPSHPFNGYEVLTPSQDYKNRHPSILLAVETCLDAISSTST